MRATTGMVVAVRLLGLAVRRLWLTVRRLLVVWLLAATLRLALSGRPLTIRGAAGLARLVRALRVLSHGWTVNA
ncbi:hypothetical protein ALI144C_11760 [Actinosynnema sp. ALI-1.44]|nr:hypothetical protein ALI144C_11760 [Actinosynnema sp. ALI-1.44]